MDSGTGVVDEASGNIGGLVVGQWGHPSLNLRRGLMIDMMDVMLDSRSAMQARPIADETEGYETAELITCSCANVERGA
jgi:hypothetical protein